MIETAHSYHHPYKPKQRFSHYVKSPDLQHGCHEIEAACRTLETDQPTPTAVIHHHHYLPQSGPNPPETTYPSKGKDHFRAATPSCASMGMPTHDLARAKSTAPPPPPPPPPPMVKKETIVEQKQFSDEVHHPMASLMKVNGGKMLGSNSVHVPCLVCGDEASGFHYGVNSCEGCKVSWTVHL